VTAVGSPGSERRWRGARGPPAHHRAVDRARAAGKAVSARQTVSVPQTRTPGRPSLSWSGPRPLPHRGRWACRTRAGPGRAVPWFRWQPRRGPTVRAATRTGSGPGTQPGHRHRPRCVPARGTGRQPARRSGAESGGRRERADAQAVARRHLGPGSATDARSLHRPLDPVLQLHRLHLRSKQAAGGTFEHLLEELLEVRD
jgi:hypothetical protein